MSTASHSTSRTPSRSPTPEPPLQPDHFYGNEDVRFPPSPNSDGRTWLDPADDPLAQRGIPVFKPTMDEFVDFEAYVNRVEPWGMRSGIVKIIPPKEWTDALPSVVPQLENVKLKNPIEQHMLGQGGLFQQQNIEKRRVMSVREWAELCAKEDLRAPGVEEVGLHARAANGTARRTRRSRKQRESETAEPDHNPEAVAIKHEDEDVEPELAPQAPISPPNSHRALSPPEDAEQQSPVQEPAAPSDIPASLSAPTATSKAGKARHPLAEEEEEEGAEDEEQEDAKQAEVGQEEENVKPKARGRRAPQTREAREALMAERAAKDREFLESFDPHTAWLPPKTTAASYTTEFCKELERRYWRNCGFGKPAWYGADMQGSLFTDETTSWNVAHLPSALSRLLPASNKGLPGVNTPYLYFGMWRATFAWHVEDMDLFSINYIHFGAPKFWYAMPQARANALEQNMRSLFPGAGKKCSQFLRHKSYLASPKLLSQASCRPNYLVQQAGEFVITFPRGYHAGFNLGFNCAESVNFALESWIDIGRKAKACGCVNFSVRIDVDKLLQDRAAENREVYRKPKKRIKTGAAAEKENKPKLSRKRKAEGDAPAKTKKQKTKPASAQEQPVASSSKLPTPAKQVKLTLKLPPRPKGPETFPCCLCVSMSREGLLPVHDPPAWWYEPGNPEAAGGKPCMAHAECASVVPETWVDEVEVGEPDANGIRSKEKRVFGVDGIVKDRWNLKCTACTKTRHRAHGAPIQCTKGKCPKAFHVSCARDGVASGIVFTVLREVEKEVVLLDNHQPSASELAPVSSAAPNIAPVPIDPALMSEQPMDVDPSYGPDAAAPSVDASLTSSTISVPQPHAGAQPQPHQPSPTPQVLKLIKKTEVEVLCHQHNPAILAAKKAQHQDRIRNQLLALPPMSRIKLRVTAGVFEVTLVRVVEESHSVEVLWDRGLKREFKWRSVVFGETDGVVGQKPTEAAPEPEAGSSAATPHSATPNAAAGQPGSVPPPSYRPSPVAHQPAHPQSYTPIAPSPSSTNTPVYASPPVASSSTQQVAPVYHPPTNAQYAQQAVYQPRTSTYQYAPGSWTYQYAATVNSFGVRANHDYQSSAAQPPPASTYPSSSYPSSSYAQTAYAPHTSGAPAPYQYPYSRHPYGSYAQYGAYHYAPPPPAAPQATPHVAAQPPPPAAAPPPPPPSQSQSRGLQWQRPYTGPKEPAPKAPTLTVPSVPQHPSQSPTPAATASDAHQGGSTEAAAASGTS
ncbi:hypothetical protein PYCCODRAFT_1437481 [Trametes coccinea BRFM310]|uniref:[histone H3]-trimethyl-L-lysine(9) demethylase n=1 Tax=Trametes coccinea (strain BRFM310) TaxID=1353009 RepID=A0A1Y2IH01_TRAC3|nr:hypothetical protein PYCCODRAFT_1437481 [Trametes coccinea BRFM310]